MYKLASALRTEQPRINATLDAEAATLPALVRPVAEHTLRAGGKRLRPLLVILTGRALGCTHDDIYSLAAAVEILHAATLLHDDVLDNAATRRGVPAAHTLFDTKTTILAGDAMLAQAASIVARPGDSRLTSAFAEAIIQTATGEVAEFTHLGNIFLDHDNYLSIIIGKTAWVLRVSCELAALRAGANPETVAAAAEFGMQLGIAFQMVDDALDIAPQKKTGKPAGGDLREKKCTPLIRFYLESLSPEAATRFAEKFAHGTFTDNEVEEIITTMRTLGLDERTRGMAAEHLANAEKALSHFPESEHKRILGRIPEYIRTRGE